MTPSKSLLHNMENRAGPHWMPLLTLILLTGLWSTQLNKTLFIAIRDHVLLSNPVGQRVNDFYYRYTPYAAEAFKSFDQKTQKTCILEGFEEDAGQKRLRKILARRDILVVADVPAPDLSLSRSNGAITLASAHGKQLVVDQTQFNKNPKSWFSAFSEAEDRFGWFRRLILAGLLVGFPCLLYATVYTLVRALLGLFFGGRRATGLSSILCLLIGVGLFIPMVRGHVAPIEADRLEAAMADPAWPVRVAALRHIQTRRLEIAAYSSFRKLLHSPMAVERYWLARALAVSRNPATYGDLLAMVNDPHPNVVCQAFYALGQRRNPAAISAIKEKMASSGHWYTQEYGYHAIKRLGWQQTPSKPTP
jgi:hypothetical protein